MSDTNGDHSTTPDRDRVLAERGGRDNVRRRVMPGRSAPPPGTDASGPLAELALLVAELRAENRMLHAQLEVARVDRHEVEELRAQLDALDPTREPAAT